MMGKRRSSSRSRRRRGDVNQISLQELDETVLSIGSRRGDTSWNDGDSVSQGSQSIATHEGHSQAHPNLISNMRDITDMRGRPLPNPYVVGPRSVSMSSRRSGRSGSSRLSRRSNRKRDALERMISLTLLETATSEDGESHFLSLAEDASHSSVVTTDDILSDLVTISTIVEQESWANRDSSGSPMNSVPKNPKPLLPNASGDSGEASSCDDNVDYNAPRPSSAPVFFKLQKHAHQTIPEEECSRAQHYHQQQHDHFQHHQTPHRNVSSPTDPFLNLDASGEHRRAQPGHRRPRDPPAVSPKQLFEQQPSTLTDEGFPATTTTEDTPVGASVTSFFRSQMDAPTEWHAEWTPFEESASPFQGASLSDASPSSVVDPFIQYAGSEDSGYGSKYSI